ncbi:MAG: glutathione S-transferase family protein [Sphingobium sp.]
MPPLLLFEHPLSPYAQKIRILLREKGLPFETRMPANIGAGGSMDDFARINPRLEVPALQVGDTALYDSTIILEYLEESFPQPPMMPPVPVDRARMRTIEEVCDTHWEAINWGLGELRFFKRGEGTSAPALRAAAERQVAQMHRWLEGLLGDAPWLTGDRFGWGDLSAIPYVAMSKMFGIAPAAGSPLAAWLERARARPSVALTVREAMDTLPGMEGVAALVRSGAFQRQFRDHRLEWMIRSGGIDVVLDGLREGNIRFTDLAVFSGGAAKANNQDGE